MTDYVDKNKRQNSFIVYLFYGTFIFKMFVYFYAVNKCKKMSEKKPDSLRVFVFMIASEAK